MSINLLYIKFNRRQVISFSIFISIISFYIVAFIRDYYFFVFGRFLSGYACSLSSPLLSNIFVEYAPVKYRSFLSSALFSGLRIGQFIVPMLMLIYMQNYQLNNIQIYNFG